MNSQNGQDKYLIEEIFKSKKDGFFVEIGANDGVKFSNTKTMEDMGWNGICIEPLPESFEKLKINRKCTVYNVAICNKTGKISFLDITGYAEMLSGIIESYNPKHLDRIENEIRTKGGEKKVIEVDSFKFSDLIKEKDIDYVSIDTEGSELEVLKSIDFDKHNIHCISVENNYKDFTIRDFLIDKGYKLVKTMGEDDIYIK